MSVPPELMSVLAKLESVLPEDRPVPLHQPLFQSNEWDYVKDCIDTGWVSSAGGYVTKFEQLLSEYTGVEHVVATVNGTAALHMAVLLAGVERDDEVLVPSLTFVATANAVSYLGARPHLVDVNPHTLGVDPDKLAMYLKEIVEVQQGVSTNRITGRPLRALVVMHAYGHPAELDHIQSICEQYSIVMIEDAAEALGSFYQGRHVGNWGRLSVLSFNGNKVVTTGGGGAILTGDPLLAKRAHHITTTAKQQHPWSYNHDEIGYNYRMPNLNAALGCAQMEHLPRYIKRKRALAERYRTAFAELTEVDIVSEPEHCRSNYWLTNLMLAPVIRDQRDVLLRVCHERGILARPVWELMHRLPMYQECPRTDLSQAESIASRLISLPSSVSLEPDND